MNLLYKGKPVSCKRLGQYSFADLMCMRNELSKLAIKRKINYNAAELSFYLNSLNIEIMRRTAIRKINCEAKSRRKIAHNRLKKSQLSKVN